VTAVSTRLLHYGAGDEPDIYGHVLRDGLHVRWEITAGKTGEPLAWGRTWTKGGAWVEAIHAAYRPGITQAWPEIDLRTRRDTVYFCATCAVDEGEQHESWCGREGVMQRGAS
jgi:hypothetical protein